MHRLRRVPPEDGGWPDGMLLGDDGMYHYRREEHTMPMGADTAEQVDLAAFHIWQYSQRHGDARDTRAMASIMRRLVRANAAVAVLAVARPSAFWELRRELIATLRRLRARNPGALTTAAVARINIAFANVFGADTQRPSDCRYAFDDDAPRRRRPSDPPDVRGPRDAATQTSPPTAPSTT